MTSEESTSADDLAELAGEAVPLADLVAYQPGAIVSRTLLNKGHTTVTLFAVASGQSISEHSAPHDALLYVLDGAATVRIDEREHTVTEGDLLVLPAEAPHALDAPQDFKMLLTMAR